uniref:Uncharacterized protein n=1 Tax=Meloidogyne enterolobii TaxID=390850 RepID=A0A6V7W458_MELEN|nr:unnamed protein product [Meloidogyne enterolobii]
MKDNESIPETMIDLTCTTALYEKEVNFYELDFPTKSKKPSCILLNNSGLAIETSKVSHAKQIVDSRNNIENKIDQIFDQNKGDWNNAIIIHHPQQDPNVDYKSNKIIKLLRAKYDEAKRKKQTPKASAAADEVNYEFDINVITERMAERCFEMFSEGNKNRNFSPTLGTKVGKSRKASTKSHPHKKTRLISNIIHDSNQTNNPHELGPNYSILESQFVGNNAGSGSSFLGSDESNPTNKPETNLLNSTVHTNTNAESNQPMNIDDVNETFEQMADYSKYFWNNDEFQNLDSILSPHQQMQGDDSTTD